MFNLKSTPILSIVLVSSVFSACGIYISSPKAKTQYGALAPSKYRNSLLSLTPGQKVAICSDPGTSPEYLDMLVKSAQTWTDLISRNNMVEKVPVCGTIPLEKYAKVIKLAYTNCDVGVMGYHAYIDNPMAMEPLAETTNYELINFCTAYPPTVSVSLHEMGHAFGLCDQYAGRGVPGSFNDNCQFSIIHSDKANPDSIMSSGHHELIEDDLIGIQVLSCLKKIPANKVWAELNSSVMQEWKRNANFVSEIQRLEAQNIGFLEECRGSYVEPDSGPVVPPTPPPFGSPIVTPIPEETPPPIIRTPSPILRPTPVPINISFPTPNMIISTNKSIKCSYEKHSERTILEVGFLFQGNDTGLISYKARRSFGLTKTITYSVEKGMDRYLRAVLKVKNSETTELYRLRMLRDALNKLSKPLSESGKKNWKITDCY